jgi:hypothetical protein
MGANGTGLDCLSSCSFDPQAPILVIGAGRSGSTLLVRVMNSHPNISFKGETKFLLAQVWSLLWQNPAWCWFESRLASNPRSSEECNADVGKQNLAAEQQRAGAICARFIASLIKADPACRFWGFKEIWNGSGSFHIPWEIYDQVFPGATWVHLIRHPLDFLGSCVGWNCCESSFSAFQQQLDEWAAIVRYSQARAATGRYFEVRYEDLKKSARTALTPLFERLGIPWDEACANTLMEKRGDSRRDTFAERHLFPRLERTPEVMYLAGQYNYSL